MSNVRKILFCLGLALSTVLSAQNYRQTETGLKFNFVKDEPGRTAALGEFVSMDLLIESDKGEVIRSTYKDGKPLLFPVKTSAHQSDIYEAVDLLSVGDSALFLINADSMYTKVFRKPLPSNVAPGSELKVTIKVHAIYNQKEYLAAQLEKKKTYEEANKAQLEKIALDDDKALKAYFDENISSYLVTPTGVYYSQPQKKKRKSPKLGETVTFNYKGMLLNGEEFESSKEMLQHPFSFTIGNAEVILGWDDVFPFLKEGESYVIGVPSHLAYGRLQKGEKIPPNAILLFEIEFLSILE